MKNKLAALLAALLLTVSLLPAQALAASDPDPVDPPAVTEAGDTKTPDESETPDDPESPEPPASPLGDPPPTKDPGEENTTH